MIWTAPGIERSEGYPARRNDPEQEMLRDWLDANLPQIVETMVAREIARITKQD